MSQVLAARVVDNGRRRLLRQHVRWLASDLSVGGRNLSRANKVIEWATLEHYREQVRATLAKCVLGLGLAIQLAHDAALTQHQIRIPPTFLLRLALATLLHEASAVREEQEVTMRTREAGPIR